MSMRPLPGSEGPPPHTKPRSRKSSVDHATGSSSNVPTAFFMKREEDLEQSTATTASTFGVQSLADTLEAAFGPQRGASEAKADGVTSTKDRGKSASRSLSHGSSSGLMRPLETSRSSPIRRLKRKSSSHASSIPFPLHKVDAASSIPPSAMPSTPTSASLHSLKLSDEESALDEVASQAIVSSDDEEQDVGTQRGPSGSFPQLVMPRIQMPTRRPFTIKGKAMGKLKVMVAGRTGTCLLSAPNAIIAMRFQFEANYVRQVLAKLL